MTLTRFVALVVGLSMALGLPLPAGASSTASIELHAHQVVTSANATDASRSNVRLVTSIHLPGNADCLLSRTATFSGTAQQAAVILTSLPLSANSRVVWIVHATLGGQRHNYDSECLSNDIPAGQYLLQYTHSPGTSRVQLNLPGLSGSGTLTPKQLDGTHIAALPSVLRTPASSATYSWGTRRTLPTLGSVLTLGVIAAGLSNQGIDAQGDCLLSPDTAVLPDQLAYAPGCPLGSSGMSDGFTGSETWQATLTSNIPAGSYGTGYWFVGTPTHHPLGAISVWITNLAT
jgi:hypothetical protein